MRATSGILGRFGASSEASPYTLVVRVTTPLAWGFAMMVSSSLSHGENRGSSSLGSANKIRYFLNYRRWRFCSNSKPTANRRDWKTARQREQYQ